MTRTILLLAFLLGLSACGESATSSGQLCTAARTGCRLVCDTVDRVCAGVTSGGDDGGDR